MVDRIRAYWIFKAVAVASGDVEADGRLTVAEVGNFVDRKKSVTGSSASSSAASQICAGV